MQRKYKKTGNKDKKKCKKSNREKRNFYVNFITFSMHCFLKKQNIVQLHCCIAHISIWTTQKHWSIGLSNIIRHLFFCSHSNLSHDFSTTAESLFVSQQNEEIRWWENWRAQKSESSWNVFFSLLELNKDQRRVTTAPEREIEFCVRRGSRKDTHSTKKCVGNPIHELERKL